MPLRRRGVQAQRCRERIGRAPTEQPATHERFERLVERALDGLPPDARRLLENVAIVIEDEPAPEQLDSNDLHDRDTLYGLYEGTPAVEYGADWVPFPNKITLFRLPLEQDFASPTELAREVRRTVLHELAHHAGLGDERLRAIDLD